MLNIALDGELRKGGTTGTPKNKFFKDGIEIMLKRCLLTLGVVIFIIALYSPARHARHYEYVKVENIYNSLELGNKNLILKDCNYQDIILNNEDVEVNSVSKPRDFSKPLAGKS